MMRKFIIIFLILFVCFVGTGAFLYSKIYSPIVKLQNGETRIVFVQSNSNFQDLQSQLNQFLISPRVFELVSKLKRFSNVKPGKYEIKNGMNANELVNLLRSGNQKAVKVTFNNIRKVDELASILGKCLEASEQEFYDYLVSESTFKEFGLTKNTFPVLFIPETYELYWNTSPEQFVRRMNIEYLKFWNQQRKDKAEEIGLSLVEISALASIVEAETKHVDEKPIVAGVYINRLKRGMLLQADPTLVFAHNDFSIRRVLNKHKQIDSPYNTYKYKGVPPGPILLPEKSSIDAVLNYKKHRYLFFCAKPDYSGYHNFSVTNRQHTNYARIYRQFLNREGIYK